MNKEYIVKKMASLILEVNYMGEDVARNIAEYLVVNDVRTSEGFEICEDWVVGKDCGIWIAPISYKGDTNE